MRDLRRHTVLVSPPKIDQTVSALMPTALVSGGDATVDIAATLVVQRSDQGLLRVIASNLGEVGDAGAATARGRRLVFADAHVLGVLTQRLTHAAGPPKISIGLLSGDNVTIARLVSLRLP